MKPSEKHYDGSIVDNECLIDVIKKECIKNIQ